MYCAKHTLHKLTSCSGLSTKQSTFWNETRVASALTWNFPSSAFCFTIRKFDRWYAQVMTCCLGADRPTIHDTMSLLLLQPHLMNMQFVTSREQRSVDIFATACFAPPPIRATWEPGADLGSVPPTVSEALCLLFAASRYAHLNGTGTHKWTGTSPCSLHQEHWY